jgi:hypothetical protein
MVAPAAFAHVFNIGTQLLGQVGQLIHEADAGGQHGVGGVFGELGTADAHANELDGAKVRGAPRHASPARRWECRRLPEF